MTIDELRDFPTDEDVDCTPEIEGCRVRVGMSARFVEDCCPEVVVHNVRLMEWNTSAAFYTRGQAGLCTDKADGQTFCNGFQRVSTVLDGEENRDEK